MNRKTTSLVIICLVLITVINSALATTVRPLSDSEFAYAFAVLSDAKKVTYSCTTYEKKSSIKITSCWLEKKNNNTWKYSKSLAVPTQEVTNNYDYIVSMDYSDSIGSGTFRVGFIVDADGHAITRYSNERTF